MKIVGGQKRAMRTDGRTGYGSRIKIRFGCLSLFYGLVGISQKITLSRLTKALCVRGICLMNRVVLEGK